MTNDERQMTKEIRNPNVEGRSGVRWLVRPSDFGIPSDFVIRHSGLRIAVHGEPAFAFCACIGTMNLIEAGLTSAAPRSVTVYDYDAPGFGLLVGEIGSG
jgi:hypothetical protein